MKAQPDFVSIADFCRRSSLGRTTVYREIERGNLAKPVRLTANRVGFPVEVVESWLASRKEAA